MELPFSRLEKKEEKKSHLPASLDLPGVRQPQPAASPPIFHSHSLSPTVSCFHVLSLASPSLSSLSGEMPLPPSLFFSLHLRRALTFHPPSIGSSAFPPSFFPTLPHPGSSSCKLLPIFFSTLFITHLIPASSSLTLTPYCYHRLCTSFPSSLLLIITFTLSVSHAYIRQIMHYPPSVLCPLWSF